MNETRNTIHAIDRKLIELEKRLDGVDHTLDVFPKIVALVNHYDNLFKEYHEYLSDMDNAASYKRASASVFKLVRYHSRVIFDEHLMRLERCEENLGGDVRGLQFTYQIIMPITDSNIRYSRQKH